METNFWRRFTDDTLVKVGLEGWSSLFNTKDVEDVTLTFWRLGLLWLCKLVFMLVLLVEGFKFSDNLGVVGWRLRSFLRLVWCYSWWLRLGVWLVGLDVGGFLEYFLIVIWFGESILVTD